MKNKPIYFPGLNGLRAIAALAVMISHIALHHANFGLNPFIFGSFSDGKPKGYLLAVYGVIIFFVLSGFLITYLFEVEKDIQPIDIKKFYVRRILRIWPLYYLYFAICLVVIYISKEHIAPIILACYILYAANIPAFIGKVIPLTAHYWSLGVEEQFYIVWPWFNKKTGKQMIPIICILIAVIMSVKIATHILLPGSLFSTVMAGIGYHCMMIGALGAILYKQQNQFFLKITDNKISQAIAWLVIFFVAINKFHIASLIDGDLVALTALTIIIGQIGIQNRLVNLEIRIFDFLGKMSYGIYVIHPIIILLFSKLFLHINLKPAFKYPLVYFSIVGTTIMISYFSYHYFEKYFLTLKKKFIVIESSASRD
jgi:peptidoglycan/LPS O-acetylase OafA/YrhL